MAPVYGTLSTTGLYTPPTSVPNAESVTITATSTADPGASATATAVVNPSPVTVAVTPASVVLGPGQTAQFSASVEGTSNTAVTWSVSPPVGSLTGAGLYTAPASVGATEAITVTATAAADPSKTGSGTATVIPAGAYSVSYAMAGPATVKVSWTAPASGTANDWIALSSPGAPGYWYTWNQGTNGAAKGSVMVNVPSSPGLWEFRYYIGKSYRVAAISPSLAVGTAGFSVSTAGTVGRGAPLTVKWTAPAGRPAGDAVDLFQAGTSNLNPITVQYVTGTSGSFTVTAPAVAGQYRFRYLLSGSGWVTAAMGPVITVQ